MEYLMTYGWAILVVVAVVAALYGLGVFKVGTGTVKCSPCFSYFAYVDYAGGILTVKNGPQDINSIVATGGNSSVTVADAGTAFNITGIAPTGTVTVTVTYAVNASSLSHTDTATIHN